MSAILEARGSLQAAVEKLESEANLPQLHIAECAAISQAISLKRIADALDGTSLGFDISQSMVCPPEHRR